MVGRPHQGQYDEENTSLGKRIKRNYVTIMTVNKTTTLNAEMWCAATTLDIG